MKHRPQRQVGEDLEEDIIGEVSKTRQKATDRFATLTRTHRDELTRVSADPLPFPHDQVLGRVATRKKVCLCVLVCPPLSLLPLSLLCVLVCPRLLPFLCYHIEYFSKRAIQSEDVTNFRIERLTFVPHNNHYHVQFWEFFTAGMC